jgi:hypothetical protein
MAMLNNQRVNQLPHCDLSGIMHSKANYPNILSIWKRGRRSLISGQCMNHYPVNHYNQWIIRFKSYNHWLLVNHISELKHLKTWCLFRRELAAGDVSSKRTAALDVPWPPWGGQRGSGLDLHDVYKLYKCIWLLYHIYICRYLDVKYCIYKTWLFHSTSIVQSRNLSRSLAESWLWHQRMVMAQTFSMIGMFAPLFRVKNWIWPDSWVTLTCFFGGFFNSQPWKEFRYIDDDIGRQLPAPRGWKAYGMQRW